MTTAAARALSDVEAAFGALLREVRTLAVRDLRARSATMAASAVVVSVLVACAMHLPDVWWAAISGFISTQPTRPASLQKALLRVTGTAAGAALGYLLAGWLAYDHAACCLCLALAGGVGIYGVVVSPHGYAWLFFGVTFTLVVLLSLNDPTQAFSLAVYRTLEVAVGTASAAVIAVLLAPDGAGGAPPTMPGWRDPFGAKWPATMHALRGGIAVGVIPLAWSTFYLPGVSAMATTVVAVLAVPVLADHPLDRGAHIVAKASYRLLGCFVGGVVSLALLALPLTVFLPWLLALWVGTWLFAWLQGSQSGAGYVGTQAAVVFLMTLVQGESPPSSILPGLDRFVGITLGVGTLLLVATLVRAPAD